MIRLLTSTLSIILRPYALASFSDLTTELVYCFRAGEGISVTGQVTRPTIGYWSLYDPLSRCIRRYIVTIGNTRENVPALFK